MIIIPNDILLTIQKNDKSYLVRTPNVQVTTPTWPGFLVKFKVTNIISTKSQPRLVYQHNNMKIKGQFDGRTLK